MGVSAALLGVCGLLASSGAAADATLPGTPRQPFLITETPFWHAFALAGRANRIDRYGCAPLAHYSGGEAVYQVEAHLSGTLSAWLEAPNDGVDNAVHLLHSVAVDPEGLVPDCLDWGPSNAEAYVEPGTYYVVVDAAGAGKGPDPFRLRVDLALDNTWYSRRVARGVTLRTLRQAQVDGAVQSFSVLDVDLADPGVHLVALDGTGCVTTSQLGKRAAAVAALNGGYFGGPQCRSGSLLKVAGELRYPNLHDRSVFGVDQRGHPMMALVKKRRDWPAAYHAVGGTPRLIKDGEVMSDTMDALDQGFAAAPHPRAAVAITTDRHVLLVAVDGRTSAGVGFTLPELTRWLLEQGATQALNMDGGGSTTLWVASEPPNGVVNFPCDNEAADHEGERPVGSAIGVFAPPLNRDPVWLTLPPDTAAAQGQPWRYHAAVADPEGAPIRFEVSRADTSSRVELKDQGDGTATLTAVPDARDAQAGHLMVGLAAVVEGGQVLSQHVQVPVHTAQPAAPIAPAAPTASTSCACSARASSPGAPVLAWALWLLWRVGARRATWRTARRGRPARGPAHRA